VTYIIAEIGPNHNGSVETAIDMIGRLALAGADAVKFQISKLENAYSADAFKVDYQNRNDDAKSPLEMAKRYQLPFEAHHTLQDVCKSAGVGYMCTAFEMESLRFLDKEMDMPYFKIPSGEIHTIDMLEYIGAGNLPILMSTGASTFDDISKALRVLEGQGAKDITLLHCVSNYPAPVEDIHLNVILELEARFGYPVGYSDHTLGNDCAVAATALGACVIEKHVTFDRYSSGPDHQASATIEEFAELVRSIRIVERARGGRQKVFSAEETKIRAAVRKSVVAARHLSQGEMISAGDILFKRPGTGLSPLTRDSIIGRTLKSDVEENHVISETDLT
jgi:N,N'-diacetyllegionaminate synthase